MELDSQIEYYLILAMEVGCSVSPNDAMNGCGADVCNHTHVFLDYFVLVSVIYCNENTIVYRISLTRS